MSNSAMTTYDSNPAGRRDLLRLAFGALIVPALWRPAAAQQVDGADAVLPIQRLDQALLVAMKAGRQTPFAQRFTALIPAIEQALDLDALLAESVGPAWTGLPPDQQALLASEFRRYTVSSYGANFDSFSGQTFRLSPTPRRLADGRVIVDTAIVRADGSATALDYVMHQTDAGWRAVDVLADGSISRVAVQRSDFRSLLRGGGVAALVAGLRRKVVSLSGGTLA